MSKNKTVRNIFLAVFCLFICASLGHAESCSSIGEVQHKYTASGCSYSTESRSCCSNGSWSDWNGSCPTAPSCPSNQCWDGTKCQSKDLPYYLEIPGSVANSVSCSYPIKCEEGKGWVKASVTPATCACKEGYQYKPTVCEKTAPKLVSEDLYTDIKKSNLPIGTSCSKLCDEAFESMVTNCSGAARCEFSHTDKTCSEVGHPTYGYVKRNGYNGYCQTLESSSGPYSVNLNCRLFYTRTYCK